MRRRGGRRGGRSSEVETGRLKAFAMVVSKSEWEARAGPARRRRREGKGSKGSKGSEGSEGQRERKTSKANKGSENARPARPAQHQQGQQCQRKSSQEAASRGRRGRRPACLSPAVIGRPGAEERGSPRRATSRVGRRPSRRALEVFRVPMPFHRFHRFHSKCAPCEGRLELGRFKVEIARRKFILRRALRA